MYTGILFIFMGVQLVVIQFSKACVKIKIDVIIILNFRTVIMFSLVYMRLQTLWKILSIRGQNI